VIIYVFLVIKMLTQGEAQLCIVVYDDKNTRYYGTVKDDRFTLIRNRDEAVVFKLQPLTGLAMSRKTRHLENKFALTFTRYNQNGSFSFWYITSSLRQTPLPEDLVEQLSSNSRAFLPLACTATGIPCVKIDTLSQSSAQISKTSSCSKQEQLLFKSFDELPESFEFENIKGCSCKSVLAAVAASSPASPPKKHTGLIIGLSSAAAVLVVIVICVAIRHTRQKKHTALPTSYQSRP
jgi:hypothetical protein